MEKELKSCSRCGNQIYCNSANIASCACNDISLNPETLVFLKKTNYDCLCNPCLDHLNKEILRVNNISVKLQENIHYYLENGNMVFTEFYHIQRGTCCGNGCRHCAYGSKG